MCVCVCVVGTDILILSVRYSDSLRYVSQCLAPDSQVRIATLYRLDGLAIESSVGARFSHPSRPTLSPLSLL
jgi:hypothetical protein